MQFKILEDHTPSIGPGTKHPITITVDNNANKINRPRIGVMFLNILNIGVTGLIVFGDLIGDLGWIWEIVDQK